MLTRTQAAYRGASAWPWMAFVRWWDEGPAVHGYANSSIDAAIAVGALLAVVWLARRRWVPEAVFAAAAVLAPLTSGLIAFSRMVLAAPVLASAVASLAASSSTPAATAPTPSGPRVRAATNRLLLWLWWTASVLVLAWFSARFATWRWVA